MDPLIKTIATGMLNGDGNSGNSSTGTSKSNGYNPYNANYIPYGQSLSHFFSGIG